LSAGQKNPIEWDVTHDYYPNVFAPPDVETAPEDEQPYPDEWPNPYTLEDAYMDRPPVVYVVDGILAEETVNMVYGDSGSLKSMLLADMCTCVSSGLSWLPNASGEGVKVNSGPVMWIDYDNGSRRSHNRFGALARARSLDTHTPIYYYSMAQPQLAANDSKHIGALYQRIMSRSVKLLVIDNLSLVSGDADENSRDMAQVLAGFRFLAERTGACIVIVHHQNKPSAVSRKTGDLLRGHSSIKAGLDVALYILRDGDEENRSDDIFISAPKTRDNDIHPFAARFCYTSMRQNELTTAKFIGIDWKDSGARSNEKMDEKIVHHLSNIGDVCAKNALHDVVGGRYKQFGEALERLVSTGTVKRQSGAKGAILYSLTSSPPPTSSGRR
jgi:RecA-family ATPase